MSGVRLGLIPRWSSILGDKKLIVDVLKEFIPDIERKSKVGRPPNHPIKDYALIIVLKESKNGSLRDGETDWSEYVCGERVDHSVIGYWENNTDPEILEIVVGTIGNVLEQLLDYEHSVADATRFSNWHMNEVGFHLLNRISDQTVYPVGICPDTLDPIPNTEDVIVPGHGFFMGDKWYDVNGVFRIALKNGYEPLISPQRTRDSGYWRKLGRKIYTKNKKKYRQRGRGESVFGSLTNEFGDRLNTRLNKTTYLRSVARVIAYQVKIFIRATHNVSTVLLVNN